MNHLAPLFEPMGPTEPQAWSTVGNPDTWRPLQDTLPLYGTRRASAEGDAASASAASLSPEAARAAGYAEGRQQATREAGEQMQRLQTAVAQLSEVWDQQARQCEADLARLALVIAEQIVLSDLPARQTYAEAMAQRALQLLAGSSSVTLRLCAADAAYLRNVDPALCARPGLRLVEYEALQPGGIVAEAEAGRVDASLAERLRAIAREVLGPQGRVP